MILSPLRNIFFLVLVKCTIFPFLPLTETTFHLTLSPGFDWQKGCTSALQKNARIKIPPLRSMSGLGIFLTEMKSAVL